MSSPEILDIVPEHVADPVRPAAWPVRLFRACRDGLLSLALNGLFVAFVLDAAWPVPTRQAAPQPISVDLLDHMPELKGTAAAEGGETGAPKSDDPPPRATTDAPRRDEAQARTEAAPVASEPPTPPEKGADVAPEAVRPPDPAPMPAVAQAEAAKTAPAATEHASPSPEAERTPAPPPPERPDNSPEARLVEAPSAPPPGPRGGGTGAAPDTPSVAEQAEPPAAVAPPVLAAPQADAEAVPPPAPRPAVPPPTIEQRRQAETTARLAAMLPFGANIAADPFGGQPATEGQGSSTAYRGQVYAAFNKGQDVIADARARHLKGQAVIAFTVDDRGGLASAAVAVSSGNPDVDQAALELIRRAAPFPAPPPGAQRSFSPAIGLGLDE